MNSSEYEKAIGRFDLYGIAVDRFLEKASKQQTKELIVKLLHYIGLTGEVGELGEKLKKAIRDGEDPLSIIQKRDEKRKKELGDIEWYVTRIESDEGYAKGEVLQGNYDKLSTREEKGCLHGDGDDRGIERHDKN